MPKQVSLLTLVLLVATAAVFLAYFNAQRNNRRLNEQLEAAEVARQHASLEIRELQSRLGYLVVNDTTKISIRQIPREFYLNTWTFRVYLPNGSNFYVGCKVNNLSDLPPSVESPPQPGKVDYSNANTTITGLSPGEYLVTARIFPSETGKRFSMVCQKTDANKTAKTKRVVSGGVVEGVKTSWPHVESGFRGTGVGESQQEYAVGKPITLLHGRGSNMHTPDSPDAPEGIFVWIGTAPDSKNAVAK